MTFVEYCRDAGLIVDHIPADDEWHRYPTETHPKKRNGSAKLFSDGRAGVCQDHAAHLEPLVWKIGKDVELPKVDTAAITRARTEAKRASVRATMAARKFFRECKPLRGSHQYLDDHHLGMEGCSGLAIDAEDWLVVPVMMGNNIMSVQRIGPDGKKLHWPGAAMKGCSFAIERAGATITVLCEGLATGLAIYSAAPLTRIVVAFDSGNMVRIAETLPRRGLACVAGDNDWETQAKTGSNPGLKAAIEAAGILGCGVAAPEILDGTDWADYRMERTTAKLENRGRQSESAIRRAVDAQIASEIQRAAKLLRPRRN